MLKSRRSTPLSSVGAAAVRRVRRHCVLVFVFGMAAAIAATARAQEAVSSGLKTPKISGWVELPVASAYIYHGYVVEDRGPVIQPYIYVEGEFYSGSGWLSSASITLGIFNNLQFGHEGIETDNTMLRSWYEMQAEAGLSFVFAESVTFSATYIRLESPNGAFISGNAISLRLGLDDERWLGAFALRPYFLWFTPIANEPHPDREVGHYFEMGVSPGVTIAKDSAYPIYVSFPAALGLGDRHYYAGQHFGFVSAGVAVSVPLTFVPKGLGDWSISGSALYYRLGSAPAAFTSDGERNKSVFTAKIATEF
jgi:hypothetical protein